tara:strand:+ start:5196 stop:9053 length:3858 start_codon:yes stop_codon:yes gene_type:complete
MANIPTKDHFGTNGHRATAQKTRDDLKQENFESYKVINATDEFENLAQPRVDYTNPEKFVTYGSAEEYYSSGIKSIYNSYPYDGSKFEKIEWHITSSGLDNHLFDKEYPRTNGNVIISYPDWGTTAATDDGGKYALPTNKEYITIFGGPNKDPNSTNLAKLFPSFGGKSNIVDAAQDRESNLTLGGPSGNTIEFWMKKDAFHATGQQEVIFDMWASGSAQGTSDYGRMCVYLNNNTTDPVLGLAYISGTVGIQDTFTTTTTSSIADGNWHHYAIAINASSGKAKLYLDGSETEEITGSPIGEVEGALVANLGAYYEARPADGLSLSSGLEEGWWSSTAAEISPLNSFDSAPAVFDADGANSLMPQASPTGNAIWDIDGSGDLMPDGEIDVNPFPVITPGWCKLSASLDEFRFWKTERDGEEIGINWNTQVYGGTNTDDANTTLGVYYKFNEGITQISSYDSSVLDYSGRISNGTWIGYTAGARSLTSAMVESGASLSEFKDPIVYSIHPEVASLMSTKTATGLEYDQQNNSSLYNSLPTWIREEDSSQQNTLKLTQVMSSYLDTLQNQITEVKNIKNLAYPSGSQKPYNFIKRNIQNLGFDTTDFFIDATVLERFMDRNEQQDFENNLNDTKNLIYQNIYNNLAYIMSSKGTEKSFRNLARCFGIDEKLLKLKVYSNNEEYKLEDRYENRTMKKRMVSFAHPARFEGSIFQTTSSVSPNQSYISAGGDFAKLHGTTIEGEFIFPEQKSPGSSYFFDTPFTKSSLFGTKEASSDSFVWAPTDNADLQVYAIREQRNSANAYFQLTSSQLGINLTSSIYGDVYDNEKWNLAVKVKNPTLSSTTTDNYIIEFQGVNSAGDRIDNSFTLSAEITSAQATAFHTAGKRVYAGAYRTNFTGTTIDKADTLASSIRYWEKYLTDDEITSHAKDAKNFGLKDPNRPVFNAENDMPAIDTLKLHWDFELVSTSDSSGLFDILDLSSGSADKVSLYGDFGNNHDGTGYGFPASSAKVVDLEYIDTLIRTNPEVSNGSDMVKVLTNSAEIREENSVPTNHVFSVEKSLYETISDEMIRNFSTEKDFASLYLTAADKYKVQHAELELMRREFFSKMENSPNVEEFYEYFKWIDDAVVAMLRQQLPAGAEVITGPANIIESHVLERSNIEHKVPTYAVSSSIAPLGIVKSGHDTGTGSGLFGKEEKFNGSFWDSRVFTGLPLLIATGDTNIDADRLRILNVINNIPKTVSTMKTEENTTVVYNKNTANEISADLTTNSDSLSSFNVGENKVKLLFKVE